MRTLNDIVPPSRRKDSDGKASNTVKISSGRSHSFPFLTLFIIIAVIGASLAALVYFSSAKVEVTPNTVSAAVQGSFTATKSSGDLPFEIITAEKIASQSVKSTGTKTVSSPASGTITIYNTQSKSQKLITNTRFATTAGLIFRINAPVTIPAGTTAKPGSITAKVYADKPGDSYNVAPTSFTVPGFAGTPQASQVYARSTSPMTGGASGTIPVIDSAVQGQAKNALINALTPDLLSSIEAQVPEGYVIIAGASHTNFQELAPAASASTGMVDVKVQGTITAIVFPNAALAKAVAGSVAGLGYQGEPLALSSTKDLKVTAPSLPEVEATSFAFTLSGTAPLVYTVDPTRIAAAVSGKSRSAAEVALTNYPEVKRAIIILRPFWRQTFPEDPASITVVEAKP